jgi:hypothetical protein
MSTLYRTGSFHPAKQGRFTREYVRGGLAKPEDRKGAIGQLCQKGGGRMISFH